MDKNLNFHYIWHNKSYNMKKLFIFLFLSLFTSITFAQHITIKPEMIGGQYNYKLIFDQEFYYPQSAIDSNAEGEIIIGFIIDKNGIGKDYEVIQSVHPDLDESFINVLRHILWQPGNVDGAIQEVRMQETRKFKLKKCLKQMKKRGYDKPTYPYSPIGDKFQIIPGKKLEQKAKPYYKNKEVNIYKFIQEYIKIPDAAVKQGIKGNVEISFIIEVSGRLSNFKEIKGIGGGCTEEAFRLMQLLKWEPAKMNGEYVRSEFNIQVNFGNSKY